MEYQTICTIKESEKSTVLLAAVELYVGPVIIKRLKGGNPEVYNCLKAENNIHIPQIYSVEEMDGELLVAEEYVDGENLKEHLQKHLLSDKEKIDLALQLCEAVEFLHGKEPTIIHRDIKPSNILVTGKGIVKLIDFDASRQYKEISNSNDTRLMGTVEYAPPEQFGYAQTDVRSDIYSMGVVFHEMRLSESKKAAGLWDAIAEKCTSFDPKNRYQNVAELKRELQRLVESKGILYRKIVFGMAGMAGVCAIIALAVCLWPKQAHPSGGGAGVADTGQDAAVLTGTPMPTKEAQETGVPSPTAVDLPSPTAMENPNPTVAGAPSPTVAEVPSPTMAAVPSPTATEIPSPTATQAPSPTATQVPSPTATQVPSPTATQAPSPTATQAPSPTATEIPSPTATQAPSPTATQVPTPTPAPEPGVILSPSPTPEPVPEEVAEQIGPNRMALEFYKDFAAEWDYLVYTTSFELDKIKSYTVRMYNLETYEVVEVPEEAVYYKNSIFHIKNSYLRELSEGYYQIEIHYTDLIDGNNTGYDDLIKICAGDKPPAKEEDFCMSNVLSYNCDAGGEVKAVLRNMVDSCFIAGKNYRVIENGRAAVLDKEYLMQYVVPGKNIRVPFYVELEDGRRQTVYVECLSNENAALTEAPVPTETPMPTETPVPTETPIPTEPPVPTQAVSSEVKPVPTIVVIPDGMSVPQAGYTDGNVDTFYKGMDESRDYIYYSTYFEGEEISFTKVTLFKAETSEYIQVPLEYIYNQNSVLHIKNSFMQELPEGEYRLDVFYKDLARGRENGMGTYLKVQEGKNTGEAASILRGVNLDFYYEYDSCMHAILSNSIDGRIKDIGTYKVLEDGRVIEISRELLLQYIEPGTYGRVNMEVELENGSQCLLEIHYMTGIPFYVQ